MVCGNALCGVGPIVSDGGVPASPTKDFSPSLDCVGGVDVVLARIDVGSSAVDAGSSAITLRGATKWAAQVGGTNDEDCAALAMDTESNTYVLGTYRFGSALNFGSLATLPIVGSVTDNGLFLAKLSSKNEWLWAIRIGSDGQTIQPDALITVGTDVVIAGRISGQNHSLLDVDMASPAFVARLSGSNGKRIWTQTLDAGYAEKSASVQVTRMTDAGGNILLAGNYGAAYTLAATPMPKPSTLMAAFVAQLEGSSGHILAARGYGDPEVRNGSQAVGIVGRTDAVGSEADSSLLLLGFSGQLNFGEPVGVLQSVGTTTWDSSLTKHAP
jgi:hypothetical protein